MRPKYKLDGKYVPKKPRGGAVLEHIIYEWHYETEAYRKQQAINADKFFKEQRESLTDRKNYHG